MLANKFGVLTHLDENVQNLADEELCTDQRTESNEKKKSTPNLYSKGKQGQHKRYYKGSMKRKRKAKLDLDFEVGEAIVFESKSGEVGKVSLYLGIVKERDNNSYVVESDVHDDRTYNVSHQDNPRSVKELIVRADELKKGGTVLVSWNLVGGFIELIPAQVVELVSDNYVWVKTEKGECVKVHVDNLVKVTKNSQIIKRQINLEDNFVRYEQLNIIELMLSATQSELNQLKDTYNRTSKQLEEQTQDTQNLQHHKTTLQDLYDKALTTIEEYRDQLMQSTVTSQKLNSLQDIITRQDKELDEMSKKMIALQEELKDLRKRYSDQAEEIKDLKRQNWNLHQKQHDLFEVTSHPSTATPSPCVQAKKIGNKTRPSSFFPITLPSHNTPSSKASRQTLKRRAALIREVLNVTSARENPSSTDVIQTLAAFLRENPEVALPACKTAKIDFVTELDAKDAVDLKVLLRLPMTRMRDLRRFLGKYGVNILPSDRRLYKEMSGRQYQAKDSVEVGIIHMKKTTHSPESPVAFFRVNNLEHYLVAHIEKQLEMGNTVNHEHYNGELWLKIGGDKGGNSTKLAFQFVNQKNSNSAAATNILSMFEAYDSYQNMESVFSNFYEQLIDLQRKGTIRISGKQYPVRLFYFGDTEFLCKTFGHMGPSSSFPCLWCKIKLKDLRKMDGKPHCPMIKKENQWQQNPNWPDQRTPHNYHQDLANLLAASNDGKITGKDHHSISKRPLLPLPADLLQIVPPSLHILLGLVVRYFKLLEDKCRQLDQADVQDGVDSLDKRWQDLSRQAKDAEIHLADAQATLREEESILHNIQLAAAGRSPKGLEKKECCMPLCKLKHCVPSEIKNKRIEWIQCVDCGVVGSQTAGWYHTFCVGISDVDVSNVANDNFSCPVCKGEVSGPEDVLDIQHDKVKTHKALVQEKQDEYERKKKELDEIYSEVVNRRGTSEKDLNNMLEKIGVHRQAYHSQCFVGNHCKLILTNIEKLTAFLPDGQFKQKMEGLFKRLRWIFSFFKARFLSDDEIKALKIRCWELGTWFPKHFPEETIPPKFHMLVCHVPEFVEKWKTIGLLSEHGLESLHKDINSMERIYCTVRNDQERMRLVIGNHQQRSTVNATSVAIQAKDKKTCYMAETTGCKGRYKLPFKGATERVCKLCGHVLKI